MRQILKDQYIDYLVALKANAHPNLSVDKNSLIVRFENTSSEYFDIVDINTPIITSMGQGSATYHNPSQKKVEIIDYEHLVNQLPPECRKNIKRADFILHHENGTDFFIINELSQSKNAGNKRSKALSQLANTLRHLLATPKQPTPKDTNKTPQLKTQQNTINYSLIISTFAP